MESRPPLFEIISIPQRGVNPPTTINYPTFRRLPARPSGGYHFAERPDSKPPMDYFSPNTPRVVHPGAAGQRARPPATDAIPATPKNTPGGPVYPAGLRRKPHFRAGNAVFVFWTPRPAPAQPRPAAPRDVIPPAMKNTPDTRDGAHRQPRRGAATPRASPRVVHPGRVLPPRPGAAGRRARQSREVSSLAGVQSPRPPLPPPAPAFSGQPRRFSLIYFTACLLIPFPYFLYFLYGFNLFPPYYGFYSPDFHPLSLLPVLLLRPVVSFVTTLWSKMLPPLTLPH
jgi:hypothetical protein